MTTYLSLLLFKLIGLEGSSDQGWTYILFLSLLSIPFLFLTYGLIILGGFFVVIAILDIIGFLLKINNTKLILIVEWLIIIPPFIYWAFEYEYWLWITLSISLFVTQLIREKKIKKISGAHITDL